MELAARIATMAANEATDDFVRGVSLDDTGKIVGVSVIQFVPVVGGHRIELVNTGGRYNSAGCLCEYDADKKIIDWWGWSGNTKVINLNANTAYFSCPCATESITDFELWDRTTNTQLVGGGRILVTPSAENGGGINA